MDRAARPMKDADRRKAKESAPNTGPMDLGSLVAHTKRYMLLSCIGEGGMGWVYRAHDPVLQRDVALKVMKPDVPPNERRRFGQEALYGAKFLHPSIVRVYDFVGVPTQGISWFAMEYLPGKDAAQILPNARKKSWRNWFPLLADIFRQVLAACQYSHDCGVVHRDVKPANLFITRDPNTNFVTTKLLDFGVALDIRQDHGEQPAEEKLVGDPRYVSPEQSRLHLPVDGRADVYSAGMSLYELATGRHPFEELVDCDVREMLEAQREQQPMLMSNFLPHDVPLDIAAGLDEIFIKACAKNPDDRFQSAGEMSAMFLSVMSELKRSGGVPAVVTPEETREEQADDPSSANDSDAESSSVGSVEAQEEPTSA